MPCPEPSREISSDHECLRNPPYTGYLARFTEKIILSGELHEKEDYMQYTKLNACNYP